MKWAYSVSSYAKLYEKYCKENLPSEADDIFKKADEYYREFMRRGHAGSRQKYDGGQYV